jgi:hypothetical protein
MLVEIGVCAILYFGFIYTLMVLVLPPNWAQVVGCFGLPLGLIIMIIFMFMNWINQPRVSKGAYVTQKTTRGRADEKGGWMPNPDPAVRGQVVLTTHWDRNKSVTGNSRSGRNVKGTEAWELKHGDLTIHPPEVHAPGGLNREEQDINAAIDRKTIFWLCVVVVVILASCAISLSFGPHVASNLAVLNTIEPTNYVTPTPNFSATEEHNTVQMVDGWMRQFEDFLNYPTDTPAP